MKVRPGFLFGMRIAISKMKIRTGTATSNGLGSPPSGPIRGVPTSMANKLFSLRLPQGSHPPSLFPRQAVGGNSLS